MNLASPELQLMVRLNSARLNFSKHKISPRQIPYILIAGIHPYCVLHTFTKYTGYQKHNAAYAVRCMLKSGILIKNDQKRYFLSENGQKAFDHALPIIKKITDEYKKQLLKEINKPLRTERYNPTEEERIEMARRMKALSDQGFSQRSIARQINLPKSTVEYYINNYAQTAQNKP